MIELTDEQKNVCMIENPCDIGHMSIIACAGSGKTLTATRRLFEIYKILKYKESIALFSYSNVAVSTFYNELSKILSIKKDNSIHISTFDSFLSEFIISSHGKRIMGCKCSPFLITGSESFLEWDKYKILITTNARGKSIKIPFTIDKLQIKQDNGSIAFYIRENSITYDIEQQDAFTKIKSVAKLGGYTHSLRSLWASFILDSEPRLIDILSKKFPYILIDEAQDIGFLHAHIIGLLSEKSKITLIGDPNQAIYNFAHADGSFLREFAQNKCDAPKAITYNWRSLESITTLAGHLSGTKTTHKRTSEKDFTGLFYLAYEPGKEGELGYSYAELLASKGYSVQNSAILCRSNDMVDKVLCKKSSVGEGNTKRFAESAIERDTYRDPRTAFNKLVKAIFSLMKEVPADIPKKISSAYWDSDSLRLRRALWTFWRSPETGLPASCLSAKSEWLPCLKDNLAIFLPEFSEVSGLQLKDSWGKFVRSNKLQEDSLYASYSKPDIPPPSVRIDTVHKAKGESLDAVLYVVTKPHLEAFLSGTGTEEGRIGYVALTRARDLFVIAIPTSCLQTHASKLAGLNIAPLPSIA